MGLAHSCLKVPKLQEFQDPLSLGGDAAASAERKGPDASNPITTSEDVKSRVVSNRLPAFVSGACSGTNREATTADSANVPRMDLGPTAGSLGSSANDATKSELEPSQLDTSSALTASTMSTFTSAQGYPYSNYELGPPCSDHEQSRLQALRALDIVDSIVVGRRSRLDEEIDMILGALMQMFRATAAMFVLFEDSRIITRNAKGIFSSGEFPYRWSFCAYTLTKQRPQTLLIPDATKDSRFSDNPFVVGAPGLRFYCGAPLVASSGHILGTLCFADLKPRTDFDAAQCRIINNMAEMAVRQLERFVANAGPAGANDAETTALSRVARTIECYEAVTGLVDISLTDGWMIMYINEAWEQLCAPWTRHQLVGRPLQRLLDLDLKSGTDLAQEQVQLSREGKEDQLAVTGDVWQEHAAALSAGMEVDLGPARLLMTGGQPSNVVVRVIVRPANCHVLDAATRMPVGVPPQAVLPPSILAAAADVQPPDVLADIPEADSTRKTAPEDQGGGAAQPHYCFITLVPIIQLANYNDLMGDADANAVGVPNSKLLTPTDELSAPLPPTPHPTARLPDMLNGPLRGPSLSSCAAAGSLTRQMTPPPSARPSMDTQDGLYGGRASRASMCASRCTGIMQASRSTAASSDVRSVESWTYGMEPIPGLRLGHLLGKGGYGRVFAASYKGQRVAAKVMSNTLLKTASCINGVSLEALLAQELEHPYIVRTYKCIVRAYGSGVILGPCTSLDDITTRATSSLACTRSMMMGCEGAGQRTGLIPTATPSDGSALPNGPSYGTATEYCRAVDCQGSNARGGIVLPAVLPKGAVVSVVGVCGGDARSSTIATHAGASIADGIPTADAAANYFDSFDAEGGDDGCGMIDQLVSGRGAPTNAASQAASSLASQAPHGQSYAPSQAPTMRQGAGDPQPTHPSITAKHHASLVPDTGNNGNNSAACAQASVASTTVGGSLAPADVSKLVASNLASPGVPPRLPSTPGIAPDRQQQGAAQVFGRAAAVAADAAAASYRSNMETISLPDGETWILQEYCSGGTLQDAVDTGRLRTKPSRVRGQPDLPAILLTAQEVASGMHCLHNRGYMHGDLSAVNVLLADVPPGEGVAESGGSVRGWVAKVSDFGLAKHLPDPNTPYVSSTYGVITHCAPEVLKSYTQTQKADSYSFGVLLWQMWTGSRPWGGMNRFQILGAVTSANSTGLRFLPNQEPPNSFRDLTLRCLSYDPLSRPTFAEICEELRLMTLDLAAAGQLCG